MKQSKALEALAALANETRLEIVRLLVPIGRSGLPAGDIARHVDISASRLSFHLSTLERARLLTSQRKSRNVYYSLNHQNLGGLIGYLLNDCCGGHAKICSCAIQKTDSAKT